MGKSGAFRKAAAAAILAGLMTPAHGGAPKAPPAKEKAALDVVRARLKDPASAQFKGVKPLDDKGSFCGWVNAKNSYGGYIGFSVFYVTAEGKVSILPPELSNDRLC